MSKKSFGILVLVVAMVLAFVACDKDSVTTINNTNQSDSTENTGDNIVAPAGNITIVSALEANKGDHDDSEDYIWNSSGEINIYLNGTSVTINGAGATASGSTVTIIAAGTYNISGSLSDGKIVVNSPGGGMVRLILNGVDIACSSSAPLFIEKADEAMILLADNTVNKLSDGNSYIYASDTIDEPNAAVFSKSDLTICGNGSLTVNANYNDGISCKDGLIIKSGTVSVTSADDGIRGKDYLVTYGGIITVKAGGDGLKSDNNKDTARGYIYIAEGALEITAAGDAIAAQTDVLIADGELSLTSGGGSSRTVTGDLSAKGIKGNINVIIEGKTISVNSADDAVHSNGNVIVNSGTLNLSSGNDGIHAESEISINSGEINISKSVEGIESPYIIVNSGIVNIEASDDGFNATNGNGGETDDGSCLYLNGGIISVNASGGDGLDSNGSMYITGGTIIVHGPQSSPEVGMDYNGTCTINGGFMVISGTNSNMTQGAGASSTQYSLKLITTTANSAGSLFHIEDSEGNDIVTFKPARSYYSIVFSSPEFKNGSTYKVYTGGASSGTETNGLYSGGEYTSGILYTSFTISGVLTNIGNASSGGGGGPSGR